MGRQRVNIQQLRDSCAPDKEPSAKVSDRSRPIEGCDDGRISKCDGSYRAKLTWSDDDTQNED